MRNSEIFDSFVKIAQEKGMISEDAPEKAKKILENNPRWDSQTVSDIEALYGVKPDTIKGMEYEHNIMEDAHPESVIISPSYDKLNGLVENNVERQNIMLHIVNKTPDGLLTQRKYAENDLLMSLVRVANDLDNRNIEDLRKLADACLVQVSPRQLTKKAQIIPIVGTIAGVITALYAQQHLSFINEGFATNHQKLLSELDDMINSSSSWGVGVSYKTEFITMLQEFRSKLIAFYDMYQKDQATIAELEKPRTAKELIEIAKKPETSSVIDAYNSMKSAFLNMLPYLNKIQKDFSSETYKAKQVEEKGFLSQLVDKTQVLHGGKGLIADDFDDVVRAIPPYTQSVKEMLNVLKGAESVKKDVTEQIMTAATQSQQLFGDEGQGSSPAQDIDQQVSQLDTDLVG